MPSAQRFKLALFVSLISVVAAQCANDTAKLPAERAISGVVIDYRSNRIGDVDKLVIKSESKLTVVHFPPHTARAVMNAAPKNQEAELTVDLSEKKDPELRSVKAASGDLDMHSIPPMAAASGKEVEITEKALSFRRDGHGSVNALVYKNYLVELPPHLVKNLQPVLADTARIVVRGYERDVSQGFVNTTGLIVVKPFSITINNTDYLL